MVIATAEKSSDASATSTGTARHDHVAARRAATMTDAQSLLDAA